MFDLARNQAKKAIESLYTGICTVYEYKEVRDPETKRTTSKEVVVIENQPCRLSFKNITQSKDGIAPKITQITKLFISNECNINPGSKIVVTQNNKTTEYKNSGEPAMYSNHQEIILELFDKWA